MTGLATFVLAERTIEEQQICSITLRAHDLKGHFNLELGGFDLLQQSQYSNEQYLRYSERTLWCIRAFIAVVEDVVGERMQ